MVDIAALAREVRTREDFARFARALAQDFREQPSRWENDRVDRYLAAVASFSEDLDGYFLNRGEAVPEGLDWRTAAMILAAASVYE